MRKTRRRGIGLAALLAGALAIVSAGPAAAAEKTLTYRGGFPLIGDQAVTVVVGADIPATAAAGSTVSVPFSLDVDAGQAAGDGLRLVGATQLSGTIKSQVNVAIGGRSVAMTRPPRAAGIRPAAPRRCRNPASRNCRDPPESFPANAILPW
jgi:hypothetical protein